MKLTDVLGELQDNWRIVLLTVLLLVSAFSVFAPAAPGGGTEELTNLSFGLELDGGTRIRAPVVGYTADGVNATGVAEDRIVDSVTAISGVTQTDVLVTFDDETGTTTVELFGTNSSWPEEISQEQFAASLRSAGVDVTEADVRYGVSESTREEIVETLRQKFNEGGFSGTEVTQTSTVNGQNFIVIESPTRSPEEIREIARERGTVRMVARYPNQSGSGYVNETVLSSEELTAARKGVATTDQRTSQTFVPITLATEETAQNFTQSLVEAGFTTRGISNCRYQVDKNDSGYCLLTVQDDRVVYAAGVAPGLADTLRSGEFVSDPAFQINTNNISEARDLQVDLRAGSLRAPLDFTDETVFTLEPALAERFKSNSLITGLVAVLAVSLVVYLRYGDARVAAPMVVTALSEVAILLGFAAAIQLQLDLSHIAGFIAVIGTGVDDLIIIADEVRQEGEVSSARVFQSRFRKAFWVIGAAAATTIVAMSPLAWLSLGDLRGFAIVTILGVIVGVLVTRPAYGDILRRLTTD
jgi:preprotein translocase subunit SecD